MATTNLIKAKELIDDLEADIVAYNEHRLNLMHKQNRNGFSQMFRGGEAEIRSISAHNTHEGRDVGRIQEGGTCVMTYGTLIEQYDFEASERDPSGLGRWVVMVFRGSNGITTQVVCGYNPCYNKHGLQSKTSYQQHRRYFITKEKDITCPRTRFREDLIGQLKEWRNAGDRLIVCLDANENIYTKSIGRALTSHMGLAMREVVGEFTGRQLGATFFRGSKPIDGVWATPDVRVTGACAMPCGFGIGDHKLFVVDFNLESLVGQAPPRVIRAAARRLNTKLPQVTQRYIDKLEHLLRSHRIAQRTLEASCSSIHPMVVKERTDAIDREKKQYMANAEKKCRRIKSGRIPFSPESAIWIRRRQVYNSLLKFKRGKIRNKANLKRAARRCGIQNALRISSKEIRARLAICEEKCEYFAQHGHRYRRKFLNRRLAAARAKKQRETELRILEIIERERQRSFWRRVNYHMQKKQGRSVRIVQVHDEEGGTTEFDTQDEVEAAIWDVIHGKRFYLAEKAPICSGGLRGDFGYMADTPAAEEVLRGTYQLRDDDHSATGELFDEIARIRQIVPEDSVDTFVHHKEWRERWRKAKEKTSSSESGLHFGHYVAASESEYIAYCHALLASIAIRKGYSPDRWERALSCMLEKIPGCSMVEKMRAILLMEADFNFTNKVIYGVRMLDNVRRHGLMPEEIFSEKGRTAEDGALAKTLFYDLVRQFRLSAAISSVDATSCYDSIAHAIASLVFQTFGVPTSAIKTMLGAIQNMKYFLRTAFGDSKNFANATIEVKYQGLCQGNGAAPAGWAVISITILGAHKRKGHGAVFYCPITDTTKTLSAVLFVDDCDLLHVAMDKQETASHAHERMQDAVDSWGQLLIATGGSYKPSKCFYHLISFGFKPNGDWYYEPNHEEEEFDLFVPTPDGSFAGIEHLPVDEPKKTLGVFTCPTGNAAGALQSIRDKAQDWVDRAKEGHITRRDVWFLTDKQMWPSAGYGIACNTAKISQLDSCLKKQYWKLLPLGGVIRSAPATLRQLDKGFFGIGCPDVVTECLVGQTKSLLTHFGCDSTLGLQLQASYNCMVLELGISPQVFQECYPKYHTWVTDCWLKTIWEKAYEYGLTVELGKEFVRLPRKRDTWFMREVLKLGLTRKELEMINRVRIFLQVLFLSEVLAANGKTLDTRYLERREDDERWSSLRFPRERPSEKSFRLWRKVLRRLVPARGIVDRLGEFLHEGYKVWEWRHDADSESLYRNCGGRMDIFKPASPASRQWSQVAEGVEVEIVGNPCVVRVNSPSSVLLLSTAAGWTSTRTV